jgi:YVTN family beta-propeller protein
MKSYGPEGYRLQPLFLFVSVAISLSLIVPSCSAQTQTPTPALLVLEKSDNTLAIVDPATLRIVARVPAGPDPHEIVASPDGKLAYISNYGGLDSALNTISVVDVAAQKALPAIQLDELHSPHGLSYAGDKLYFTAETNKVIGRYDPARKSIDWILGIGQDRTHMIFADETQDRILTSNVNSGTISIIERFELAAPGPPPGAPHKTWRVANVPSGRGCEGFDISPDRREIWAANANDNTVTVIDLASRRATATFPIPVDHANRLKFTPDGKRVLVSGLGAGSGPNPDNFAILDVATHKEIKGFALGGGSAGILVLPDGSRAYVAVSARDKVVAIDLQKLEVVGQIPTGKNPDGLAWAANH